MSAAGTVFKILRHARGMNSKGAAQKSGLDVALVNRLENGLKPSAEHVRRLARAYRVRETNLHKAIAIVALSNENERDR